MLCLLLAVPHTRLHLLPYVLSGARRQAHLEIAASCCVMTLRIQKLYGFLGKITHTLVVGIALERIWLTLVVDQFPAGTGEQEGAHCLLSVAVRNCE